MLARVDMVLMGPAEPLKVPLTLGVEGAEDRGLRIDSEKPDVNRESKQQGVYHANNCRCRILYATCSRW